MKIVKLQSPAIAKIMKVDIGMNNRSLRVSRHFYASTRQATDVLNIVCLVVCRRCWCSCRRSSASCIKRC